MSASVCTRSAAIATRGETRPPCPMLNSGFKQRHQPGVQVSGHAEESDVAIRPMRAKTKQLRSTCLLARVHTRKCVIPPS